MNNLKAVSKAYGMNTIGSGAMNSFLRNVIGEYMTTIGKNKKVVMVNADLSGTCRNRGFSKEFPERSFNTGIAEQNMVSFAAGLASEGFIPYVFSMAPFLSMRACEQVRTDVAYGNKNVKMIGVYAGVSGGISGATHWAIEDVGIMTTIPNIVVFEVCDANQAQRVLDFSLLYDGPIYIRCGVEPTDDIYDKDIGVVLGGSNTVVTGSDGAILCSGVVVQYAIKAAALVFEKTGKRIRVVDMYSIKPIDKKAVKEAAKTGHVIVVQDHNIYGGLGSLVAHEIAMSGMKTAFNILGVPDRFDAMAHAPFLYRKYGIDETGISNSMIELF